MLLPSNDGCDGDKNFSLLNKWHFNETNASIDAKTVHHFSGKIAPPFFTIDFI
jgi:hypothetical protein